MFGYFSASQVCVDMETNAQPVINERLDELFHNLLPGALDLVHQDHCARGNTQHTYYCFETLPLPLQKKMI